MILQEIYKDDPWKMLCGCILLNLTTREQVDRVRDRLFELYPGPEEMADAEDKVLGDLIMSLGLWRRRAHTLKRFSAEFIAAKRVTNRGTLTACEVSKLYGVGKYAVDSYRIFVLGERLRITDVQDKVLRAYVQERFAV